MTFANFLDSLSQWRGLVGSFAQEGSVVESEFKTFAVVASLPGPVSRTSAAIVQHSLCHLTIGAAARL